MEVETKTPEQGLSYRPDIDGLRAIAVAGVVLFHAKLGVSGGYVGVDVFFVISGFLITSLILHDMRKGQFHLVRFWERRVRRILPALSLVVVTTLVAGWFLLLPLDYQQLGESAVAQALLAANFYFWWHTTYFALWNETRPLLHTWSLAVEEQFYLLYPLLLLGLGALSRRRLVAVLALVLLVSFLLCWRLSYTNTIANFFLLPTRAWELLLGALPAVLGTSPHWSRAGREIVGWTGLLGIGAAMAMYEEATRFPGLTAVAPCAGAAALIAANGAGLTSTGRLLALRPLVLLGLISYSLYLWHWPVLVYASYVEFGSIPFGQRILLVIICILLAAMTWRWVEQPFRQRRLLPGRAPIFAFAGAATGLVLLLGWGVGWHEGVPSRVPLRAQELAAARSDQAFTDDVGLLDALHGKFFAVGLANPQAHPRLMVWGDSHAKALLPIIDVLCREKGIRGLAATHASTPPVLGYVGSSPFSLGQRSVPYSQAVVRYVRDHQVGDVVLAAAWAHVKGKMNLRPGLVETVKALEAAGCRVWLVRDVPLAGLHVTRALAYASWAGRVKPEDVVFPLNEFGADQKFQDDLFAGLASRQTTILNPAPYFLGPDNRLVVMENGRPLYADSQHLTTVGAARLRPLFEPIIERIAANSASPAQR